MTTSRLPFAEQVTPGGYRAGEVTSALQKALRRGEEREALHWMSELDLAGFPGYVWKRLRIIASEDVGLADPSVPVLVRTLFENWLEQRKADKGDSGNTRLFLVHAVIVLARELGGISQRDLREVACLGVWHRLN